MPQATDSDPSIFAGVSIGVIGSGAMGQALMSGWRDASWMDPETPITAIVRDRPKYVHLEDDLKITVTEDFAPLSESKIVVIAIKPQVIKEKLRDFAQVIPKDAIIISTAAGITTEFIHSVFPQTREIVRAMPNTPARIHRGVTGVSGGAECSQEAIDITVLLMSAVGEVVVVPESLQNELAAVSGSGPAYLFYLAENLMKGAIDLGLDPAIARSLVTSTLTGAAELLAHSGADPEDLRAQVTSKGGMTLAAMQVLDAREVDHTIVAALARGRERAEELGTE